MTVGAGGFIVTGDVANDVSLALGLQSWFESDDNRNRIIREVANIRSRFAAEPTLDHVVRLLSACGAAHLRTATRDDGICVREFAHPPGWCVRYTDDIIRLLVAHGYHVTPARSALAG